MKTRHYFLRYRGSVTNGSVRRKGSLVSFFPCEDTASILKISGSVTNDSVRSRVSLVRFIPSEDTALILKIPWFRY